jgi:hypothetical protein
MNRPYVEPIIDPVYQINIGIDDGDPMSLRRESLCQMDSDHSCTHDDDT